MKRPFFSIIVPVFNAEKYLRRALESVINQKFDDYEIILVNDGSKDNSLEICNEYGLKHQNIKIISTANRGSLLARKMGIDNAIGEYCLFLDADDSYDVNLLREVYNIILRTGCDLVLFKLRYVNYRGQIIEQKPLFADGTVFNDSNKLEFFKKAIAEQLCNTLYTKAVKKEIIDTVTILKYIEVTNSTDLIQSLPIYINARKIYYMDKPLYNYFEIENSITHSYNPSRYKTFIIVDKAIKEYMKKTNISNDSTIKKVKMINCIRIVEYICSLSNGNLTNNEVINEIERVANSEFFNKNVSPETIKGIKVSYKILLNLIKGRRYYIAFVLVRLFGFKILMRRVFRKTVNIFNKGLAI